MPEATKTVPEETYRVYVSCGNCGGPASFVHRGENVDIPKGQSVAETPCPRCGVKALTRRA